MDISVLIDSVIPVNSAEQRRAALVVAVRDELMLAYAGYMVGI